MIKDRLIIDDQPADLSEGSPIAMTYQVNDMAKLSDRQANYSTSIKLPLTTNNVSLWGYPNLDAFTLSQPYRKLPCKLIRNGVEMVPNGVCSLLSVSNNFIECQITYGLSGFITALKTSVIKGTEVTDIKDTTFKDLDWSDMPPFTFDLATVAASQNGDGVIWGVIDYGDSLNNSSVIVTSYLRPGVTYQQIFDRVSRYTGYKFYGGKAFTDGLSEYIPFSDSKLYDLFGNDYATSGLQLAVNTNLPDFTVKDWLFDFMWRYFLTPVVDNARKTVTFKSFDDAYDNKNKAADWTNKFVDSSRNVEFTFGEYAQRNKFLWEDDGFLSNPGTYILSVANENLEAVTDLITSKFAATENVKKLGDRDVAQIKKFKVSPLPGFGGIFDIETKPRVVRLENSGGNFNFTDGRSTVLRNGIKKGRFLNWTDQINMYGTGFIKLLNKARVINRYAVLSEYDLINFDHFTPVYDGREGKYYYVNKISNYIPGKPVQVSLIRM